MTDAQLDEAARTAREETDGESDRADETLARIQRSLVSGTAEFDDAFFDEAWAGEPVSAAHEELDAARSGDALLDAGIVEDALFGDVVGSLVSAADRPSNAASLAGGEALLDAATASLRADTGERADEAETLARILGTLRESSTTASLDAAVTAFRDETAGRPGTVRELRTPSSRRSSSPGRLALAAAALLGLIVVAPQAWAWSSELVQRWFNWDREQPARTEPPHQPRTRETEAPLEDRSTTEVAPSIAPTGPRVTPRPIAPSPSVAPPVTVPRSVDPPSAPVPRPADRSRRTPLAQREPSIDPTSEPPAAVENAREREVFEQAHRAHFGNGGPRLAVDAWSNYLAQYPNGRYAPEATYNRALAYVRLGRHDDAVRALTPFANGAYGEYRRAEARLLIDALRARAQ